MILPDFQRILNLSYRVGRIFGFADYTQVLSKIKPFWEYLEWEIGHKTAKMIKKATSIEKYEKAVASIG